MKILLTIVRKSLKYLLIGGLFLCLTAVLLLTTPWGTSLTLSLVNLSKHIHIDHAQGALMGQLVLRSVALNTEGLNLSLNNTKLDWQLSCLLKGEICLNQLSNEKLSLSVNTSPTTKADEPKKNNALIDLPVKFTIRKLSFKDNSITIDQHKIMLASFSTTLVGSGSAISVNQPIFSKLSVITEETENHTPSAAPLQTGQLSSSRQPDDWPLANLPTVYIPIKLKVNQFQLTDFSFTQSKSEKNNQKRSAPAKPYIVEHLKFDLIAGETDASISDLQLALPDIGDLTLETSISLQHKYPLSLSLTASLNSFKQYPAISGSQLKLKLTGDLDKLSYQFDSEGKLEAESHGEANLSNSQLPYNIELEVKKFPLPEETVQSIGSATLKLYSHGNVREQTLDLQSQFSASGYQNAQLSLDLTNKDSTLSIKELKLVDPETNSDLSVSGSLSYREKVEWVLKIASQGFTIPALTPAINGRINGQFKSHGFWESGKKQLHKKAKSPAPDSDARWQVMLEDTKLRGVINQYPAQLTGHINIDQEFNLLPSALAITLNDSQFNLSGYSDEQWHLDSHIQIRDFSQWNKLTKGNAKLKLNVTGQKQAPVINIDGVFNKFTLAELSNKRFSIKGSYQPFALNTENQPEPFHKSQLTFNLAKTQIASESVAPAILTVKTDKFEQNLRLIMKPLQTQYGLNINLNGKLEQSGSQWKGALSEMTLNSPYGTVELEKTVDLNAQLNDKTLTVSPHCWLAPGTQLCLDDNLISQKEGRLDIQLSSELNELSQHFLLPHKIELNSRLSSQFRLNWDQINGIALKAATTLKKGQLKFENENHVLNWTDSQFNLVSKQGKNQLIFNFSQQDTPVITGEVTAIKQEEQSTPGDVLSGAIKINKLDTAQLIGFSPALKELEGIINASIAISGTTLSPELSGELNLQDMAIQLAANPTKINQVNLQAAFKEKQASITGSASIGGGKLNLSGQGAWLEENKSVTLRLKGKKLKALYPPDSFSSISPDLTASFKNKSLNISGDVIIEEGLLKLEKLPESSISVSDDIVFVDDDGNQQKKEAAIAMLLDINLKISDQFSVDAMGFKGNVGGDLSISQKPKKPLQLFGEINIHKGLYKAYGQDLRVEQGQLLFNGAVNNPFIDIKAARFIEKDDIKAGVQLTGQAESLNVNFYSEPTFDQNEILSYIVRGRGLDDKTGGASPVAMLVGAGISNYSSVFQQLERIPLLSNIEVDTQGEGDDTQATISGYVGERIYIKYGIGITDAGKELTTRFYLMNKLWVENVTSLENKATDIYYSFDID